jgi:adenylate kinase family enzyme
MQRINVVGASGSGKSTFGAALAERLQAALVELDELFWRTGWQQAPNDEFRAAVDAALAVDRWVVCGNYNSRVRDLVWGRADTIVWLDYPLPLTFHRLFRRTWRRLVTQEELWGGNRESWRGQFLSRDSLFVYILRTHRRRKTETEADITSGRYDHLQVHRFRHPRAAEAWLAAVPPAAGRSIT